MKANAFIKVILTEVQDDEKGIRLVETVFDDIKKLVFNFDNDTISLELSTREHALLWPAAIKGYQDMVLDYLSKEGHVSPEEQNETEKVTEPSDSA